MRRLAQRVPQLLKRRQPLRSASATRISGTRSTRSHHSLSLAPRLSSASPRRKMQPSARASSSSLD